MPTRRRTSHLVGVDLGGTKIQAIQVAGDEKYPDELRLKYRFIDLRREKMQRNIKLRAGVIASIRRRMIDSGFTEFQTPILTASSPEGARDFLVPSRNHPGTFYALPQAPQQFKQLAMVAGFDRYFQIAPCFRDEASRADRSPGEFYQLDFEMSFVTQEDVFNTIEPVIAGVLRAAGISFPGSAQETMPRPVVSSWPVQLVGLVRSGVRGIPLSGFPKYCPGPYGSVWKIGLPSNIGAVAPPP